MATIVGTLQDKLDSTLRNLRHEVKGWLRIDPLPKS